MAKQDTLQTIEIPRDLKNCHPLVLATREALEITKPNADGVLWTGQPGTLKIIAGRESLSRALRIMEGIVRACLSKGWSVESSETEAATCVIIGEDPVHVELYEQLERYEVEAIAKAKAQPWYRPEFRHRPTGRLTLHITDYLWDGLRSTWGDGKHQRLEKILGGFVEGLTLASHNRRLKRLERAATERAREEAKRIREETENRIKDEAERRQTLLSQCDGLKKAMEIRDLVRILAEKERAESGKYDRIAVMHWCDWALRFAESLDPFQNGYFDSLIAKHPADQGSELDFENKHG